MKMLGIVSLLLFSLIYGNKANAIVFIPAVILIPIAKIVAVIIAGLSAPAALSGIVVSKTTKKPLKKLLVIAFSIVLLTALVAGVVLKLTNPDRPIL